MQCRPDQGRFLGFTNKFPILGVEVPVWQDAKPQDNLDMPSFRNAAGRDASSFKIKILFRVFSWVSWLRSSVVALIRAPLPAVIPVCRDQSVLLYLTRIFQWLVRFQRRSRCQFSYFFFDRGHFSLDSFLRGTMFRNFLLFNKVQ